MPPGRHKSGKTTMQSIADSLGISKVSVSKALNGKSGISDGLRQSIFSTALIIVGNDELAQNTLPPQMQMEEFSGVAVAGEMPDAFLRLLEKPGRPLVLMHPSDGQLPLGQRDHPAAGGSGP